jgi:glyoxylase-like metal-dependent hydrolase (beta-lactamase superfamily II)
MDIIRLMPRLHFIQLPVGQAYLWSDPDGLTLIDAGLPGSGPLIAAAIHQAGYQPADLRRLVLTHFHPDHVGVVREYLHLAPADDVARGADVVGVKVRQDQPP